MYMAMNTINNNIGIDLDDVLADTTPALISFHNDFYAAISVQSIAGL